MNNKPVEKTHELKASETALINFIRHQQQSLISLVLSQIASERLSYPITERTQFSLDPELKEMVLTELEPPKEESPIKAAK